MINYFFKDNVFSDVSLHSILDCEPSYANQFVCLILAGIAMELTMDILGKIVTMVCQQCSEGYKDNLLEDQINKLKNEAFCRLTLESYDKWSNDDEKSIFEELLKCFDNNYDQTTEAFMKNDARRGKWKNYSFVGKGKEIAMGMQHMISGLFGLYAVCMTNNQDSFLQCARWGILFEAGWELFSIFKNILYPLFFLGEFSMMSLLDLFHHVTLYFFLPMNLTLLPSRIGRDVSLAIFLYAAAPGFGILISQVKNNADASTPMGMAVTLLSQLALGIIFIPTRGVHWWYFAYTLLKFAWDEKVSWPIFLFYVLFVVFFSIFNIFNMLWMWKGMVKSYKKYQKFITSSEKEDKKEVLNRLPLRKSAKSSSMMDAMANHVNMSSSNRSSLRRSASLMGVDYELDEDEVQEVAKLTSMRNLKLSSNMSFRGSTLLSSPSLDHVKEQ